MSGLIEFIWINNNFIYCGVVVINVFCEWMYGNIGIMIEYMV